MGRHSNVPTIYDDCKTITISNLKTWKYLNPNTQTSGNIVWSKNGERKGNVLITVCMNPEDTYVEFDYTCNGEVIKYQIRLVQVPSNLGKGYLWFFLCPKTRKLCRKLFLVNTYFYHRTAFKGGFYNKQTLSHKNRNLVVQWDKLCKSEKANDVIYGKHLKKHYKGIPTKRYLKMLKQIKEGEGISEEELLML